MIIISLTKNRRLCLKLKRGIQNTFIYIPNIHTFQVKYS